jgi:hypothetical protein
VSLSRRHFLALSFFALPGFRRWPQALGVDGHPTPRPGITAAKVLTEKELEDSPGAIVAFNEVRQIPQIADGIRCHCGCADVDGYYSLLTCYERPVAMATVCDTCQGQGRYAYRLHRAGKSLDDIRAAIDARFG